MDSNFSMVVPTVFFNERELVGGKKVRYVSGESLIHALKSEFRRNGITVDGKSYYFWSDKFEELGDIEAQQSHNGSSQEDTRRHRMDFDCDILVMRVGDKLLTFHAQKDQEGNSGQGV